MTPQEEFERMAGMEPKAAPNTENKTSTRARRRERKINQVVQEKLSGGIFLRPINVAMSLLLISITIAGAYMGGKHVGAKTATSKIDQTLREQILITEALARKETLEKTKAQLRQLKKELESKREAFEDASDAAEIEALRARLAELESKK